LVRFDLCFGDWEEFQKYGQLEPGVPKFVPIPGWEFVVQFGAPSTGPADAPKLWAIRITKGVETLTAEGRIQGMVATLRKTILRGGEFRFGPAPEHVQSFFMALADLELLERMTEQVLEIPSWQELLALLPEDL
jgi:hypothetical protein